ncbi:MAG: YcgL domain-containing protein [Succinivibrionaceae bacterium]
MNCFTYRSTKKDGVYLYLSNPNDFEKIPEELKKLIGKAEFMLKFDLYPGRKIVKIKAEDLIKALEKEGFYLRIDTIEEATNLLNEDRRRRGLSNIKNEKLI